MRSIRFFWLAAIPAMVAGSDARLPGIFFSNAESGTAEVRYIGMTSKLRAGFATDGVTFWAHGFRLRQLFLGVNRSADIEGVDPLDAHVNFLLGAQKKDWRTNVPVYQSILYRNLYPGVDLQYRVEADRLKSEYRIVPGGAPRQIRIRYRGAKRIRIRDDGGLIIEGQDGEVREDAPLIYQDTGLGRVRVKGGYRLFDARTVGFYVGRHDRLKPLIIDPVISYSSYLGGQGTTAINSVAVDKSGNLYATGWTDATDFPTMGAIQGSNQGGVDAFIAKLNASGSALVYATYIGGASDDRATAIAVDANGQAYVTGSTTSTNFPVQSAIQSTLAGGRNAFVLKLNSAGNGFVYSTYLGGNIYDVGQAIAADATGSAYIAGETMSSNFPVLNAVQPTFGGNTDAFVTKLSSAGALSFSTFLGGSASDSAGGIAVDASGNVYLAGGTSSTNFPVAAALQPSNGGTQNAFVTKLSASGSSFIYSTYLGGSGSSGVPAESLLEQANAIAVDSSGNAWVTGVTDSANFPVTSNALRNAYNGVQDAFVVTLNPSGSALISGTYLGGSTSNWASGVSLDGAGNAFLAGNTTSVDFPLASPLQSTFGGLSDAFLAAIDSTGSVLLFSTFYGGSGADAANAIAVDASGDIYAVGQTNSADFPLQAPFQSSSLGDSTGWVLRAAQQQELLTISISPPGAGTVTVSPQSPGFYYNSGTAVQLTAAAASGYTFGAYSGALLGSANPQTIVMSAPESVTAVFNPICTFFLSSSSANVANTAGTATVSVTGSAPGCAYSAASDATWLTITSGATGSGSGVVTYAYSANTTGSARTGTLTIAGWVFTVLQNSNVPTISVSDNSLNFGVNGSRVSGTQTVILTTSGPSTVSWTASSNKPNITVSPTTGTGSATLQITATAGSSGVVSVTSPGASNSPQNIQINVEDVGSGSPFGSFDTPVNDTTGIAGAIAVTGWALDNVEVSLVDIWRAPVTGETPGSNGLVLIGDATFVAGTRPDVQAAYPNEPFNYQAGWGYLMLTDELPDSNGSGGVGNGTYVLHAIAHNLAGVETDLGARTITVNNAQATKPFGTIDTPTQGETISGTFTNFGWALTQQPFAIPTDGSTITVIVDGVAIGNPVYNQFRSDIAGLFPGLANSNGAIGFFFLDTTTLSNGLHTLSWSVIDNAGRADGVGSRFFTVLNGAQ
jgi:Divergent InlB B-repeat domain/Beta-propeller repeat/Viral BACON domain